VITAVNGTAVESSSTISTLLMDMKPGDTVTLSISRALDNTTFEAQVTLAEYQGD
jgi:S1-C subfamily serine protease